MAKKKQEGIFGSIRINKQKYIDEFIKLYKEGLNDSEIARCPFDSQEQIMLQVMKWLYHNDDVNLWMNELNKSLNIALSCDNLPEILSSLQNITNDEYVLKINVFTAQRLRLAMFWLVSHQAVFTQTVSALFVRL